MMYHSLSGIRIVVFIAFLTCPPAGKAIANLHWQRRLVKSGTGAAAATTGSWDGCRPAPTLPLEPNRPPIALKSAFTSTSETASSIHPRCLRETYNEYSPNPRSKIPFHSRFDGEKARISRLVESAEQRLCFSARLLPRTAFIGWSTTSLSPLLWWLSAGRQVLTGARRNLLAVTL